MDLPQQRRHLDQKHCRYIPHILLIPQGGSLDRMSSDATLHTIHMVNLRCNGGHVWMNAEMFVARHPYYAVTDDSGRFQFTDVPPGTYQIVAWHEGWNLAGKEHAYDVLTEHSVQRPVFTLPKTWEKSVTVSANGVTSLEFVISNK